MRQETIKAIRAKLSKIREELEKIKTVQTEVIKAVNTNTKIDTTKLETDSTTIK